MLNPLSKAKVSTNHKKWNFNNAHVNNNITGENSGKNDMNIFFILSYAEWLKFLLQLYI
jgi:hypothetical protein